MLIKRGIHFTGMMEKLRRSIIGQKPIPASQAPGRSLRIFCHQVFKVKLPDCIKMVAKKMQVKEGPNKTRIQEEIEKDVSCILFVCVTFNTNFSILKLGSYLVPKNTCKESMQE